MSRLKLRTVKMKKYPHGRYKFKILLKRNLRQIHYCTTNAPECVEIKNFLFRSSSGQSLFVYTNNARKKQIFTELYLTDLMDVTLLKLTHADKLHKIYKIIVED